MSEPGIDRPFGASVGRIHGLDAFRGTCLILMVLYHWAYDLYIYSGFAWARLDLPFWVVCQVVSSYGFIFVAGMSSRLSHGNIRRGVRVLLAGLAVSLVTWLWGEPVRFGILQLLGCAMIVYGLTRKLWRAVPARGLLALFLVLFAGARLLLPATVTAPGLYPFGLVTEDFASSDYYPLFPWLFLFLAGTCAGQWLKRPPDWLCQSRFPVLQFLGRHALLLYLIHQPVLMGLTFLTARLAGGSNWNLFLRHVSGSIGGLPFGPD